MRICTIQISRKELQRFYLEGLLHVLVEAGRDRSSNKKSHPDPTEIVHGLKIGVKINLNNRDSVRRRQFVNTLTVIVEIWTPVTIGVGKSKWDGKGSMSNINE
uniref:Uncharacterized protein n=1 Tax=Glossina palpalis gambiensis TaxID=67801 RepID=A0A1B0APY9_9MUSC